MQFAVGFKFERKTEHVVVDAEPDSPFARDASNKVVRRSWSVAGRVASMKILVSSLISRRCKVADCYGRDIRRRFSSGC